MQRKINKSCMKEIKLESIKEREGQRGKRKNEGKISWKTKIGRVIKETNKEKKEEIKRERRKEKREKEEKKK